MSEDAVLVQALESMTSLRLQSSSTLELPTEIFAILAEFLAGDCAFGTLASLNVISRDIRTETLPVLYETLPLDKGYQLASMRADGYRGMPMGTKYTKYLIFRRSQLQPSPLHELSSVFPKLVMSAMLTELASDPNELHVSVHKPVSFRTVFGVILQTPLHHRPFNHMLCDKNVFFEVFRPSHNDRPAFSPTIPDCQRDNRRPLLRAPQNVSFINLFSGAFLFGDWSPEHIGWSTTIRLHDTVLKEVNVPLHGGLTQHPETLIGLMLLPMMDIARDEYRDLDRVFSLPKSMWRPAGTRCVHTFLYGQWHLQLEMSYVAALNFLDAFTATMRHSPLSPRLRLKILISDTISSAQFQGLIKPFADFFGYGLSRECVLLGIGPPWTTLALASSYGVSVASGRYMLTRHVANLQYTLEGKAMLATCVQREDEQPLQGHVDNMDFGLFDYDD